MRTQTQHYADIRFWARRYAERLRWERKYPDDNASGYLAAMRSMLEISMALYKAHMKSKEIKK